MNFVCFDFSIAYQPSAVLLSKYWLLKKQHQGATFDVLSAFSL